MQKFQYYKTSIDGANDSDLLKHMKTLDLLGWELVSVLNHGMFYILFWKKRISEII
jgi:hypothetical protein